MSKLNVISPCRWCESPDTTMKGNGSNYWCRCLKCNAEGPVSGSEQGAVDLWNRKPSVSIPPIQLDYLIDRLRGLSEDLANKSFNDISSDLKDVVRGVTTFKNWQGNEEKPPEPTKQLTHKYSESDFSRLSLNGSNEHGLACNVFINEFDRIVSRIEHITPKAMMKELNGLVKITKCQDGWVTISSDNNKPDLPLASVVGELKFIEILITTPDIRLNDDSYSNGAIFDAPWGKATVKDSDIESLVLKLPRGDGNKAELTKALRRINSFNEDVPF